LQNQTALFAYRVDQFTQQPGLADSGFAADDRGRAALRRLGVAKAFYQRGQLFAAPKKALEERRAGDLQGLTVQGLTVQG
jgi:hypothetical protein